jgi:hypothetical protein
MNRRFIFAIGRSKEGIVYDGLVEGERVHIILLLIASENARDYLGALAGVARLARDRALVESLVDAPDLGVLFDRLSSGFGGLAVKPGLAKQSRANRLIYESAERISQGGHCSAVAIFADTLTTPPEVPIKFKGIRTILVTRDADESGFDTSKYSAVVQVSNTVFGKPVSIPPMTIVGLRFEFGLQSSSSATPLTELVGPAMAAGLVTATAGLPNDSTSGTPANALRSAEVDRSPRGIRRVAEGSRGEQTGQPVRRLKTL